MPFGKGGAYWLLLGPGVELRRSDYDLSEAAVRIRGTDYPQAIDFAQRLTGPRKGLAITSNASWRR